MSSIAVAGIPLGLALFFMIMWIRARRAASLTENVAYGLRAQDNKDEVTRTNLTVMNMEHQAAIEKLENMGEINRDDQGRWIWTESGRPLGQ